MSEHPARVHRLFVDAGLASRASVELPEAAAHHAARVLRLRDGDAVVLFDGRGGEYAARLAMPGRGRVLAELGERRDLERESPLAVTLVQAVSSSDKMDLTVQKAVELGVAAIHPVLTAKSLVRLSGEREAKKLAHWRRIAIAACEQCGRNRIPEIREPVALQRYRFPAGAKILLSPSGSQKLANLAKSPVVLAAGPEAGFSSEEEAFLLRAGFAPVRLGPRILRTETAALAALAALNALAGDF
ncbi:MAG TPA: 16S rRNA (uracil(1498)-N(3))-methyltransferase [Burkholderiales bacterium]|nr:16S rRNA (uracil(1498)-N(3))-methyltransferase [Burkholderiales bacterium]